MYIKLPIKPVKKLKVWSYVLYLLHNLVTHTSEKDGSVQKAELNFNILARTNSKLKLTLR